MNSNELKWKRFRSVRTCWPNISGSPDTENRQGAHEPSHLLRWCSTDPRPVHFDPLVAHSQPPPCWHWPDRAIPSYPRLNYHFN